MSTPVNPLPPLLAKKRVYKCKITKKRNEIVRDMDNNTNTEDFREDLKEFNDSHRKIQEIFERIYECDLSDEDINKYLDEETHIKSIYRNR